MHTPKGWIKINMITNPKSYLLRPLHSKLCTARHESSETNALTQETNPPNQFFPMHTLEGLLIQHHFSLDHYIVDLIVL
jgi:hypothetical protein